MLDAMKTCGPPGLLVPVLAALALVLAIAGAVLAFAKKRRIASVVVGLSLFVTGATGLAGFTGTLLGRAQVSRAVESAGLTKGDQERLRHEGGLEARSCSRLGAGAAVAPFFIGCIGAIAALFGKGKDGEGEGDGAVVPAILLGAAAAFTGLLASGGLGAARVAGADYEPKVWSLMSTSERVVASSAGDLGAACEALEASLAGSGTDGERACGGRIELDLAAVSELPAASERCVRDRIALAGKSSPDDRKALAKATRCSATFAVLPAAARSALEPQVHAFE